jgi:hypothetical protein
VATIIDSRDNLRYEVIKVSGLIDDPLRVVLDSGTGTKPASVDAFGRLRVADPFTLFDSSHRYQDNGFWATSTATGGTALFNANQGLIDLAVTTGSGSKVYRETYKVFSYQPGKSLLTLNTFVFNEEKENLRQRAGYFDDANGFFLELDGTTLSLVRRSSVSGVIVETKVPQSNWNLDKLNGTGISGVTLDITKAQILWMDMEWLGVGSVRMGFVIDGVFITCHTFNHANIVNSTYITTATLPVRYEIENTGATTSISTLKQVCSSVISEGGYQLSGNSHSISTPVTTPRTLTTAGTVYPIVSIQLKTSPFRLNAVSILTSISLLGVASNTNFRWEVIDGGTTAGGSWSAGSATSNVEYKINGTGITGGTTIASGFISSTNQSRGNIDFLTSNLFQYQLQRDPFTATPRELTFAVSASSNNADIHASLDYQDITH